MSIHEWGVGDRFIYEDRYFYEIIRIRKETDSVWLQSLHTMDDEPSIKISLKFLYTQAAMNYLKLIPKKELKITIRRKV